MATTYVLDLLYENYFENIFFLKAELHTSYLKIILEHYSERGRPTT